MKQALLYFVPFLLSVPAFAQRTAEPVKNNSNKIIAIFPDTLSEAQIYQQVGRALVQQGFNVDSREQSFGLLLATLYLDRDTMSLRVTVIGHEVAITGRNAVSGEVYRVTYKDYLSGSQVRWARIMKVFEKFPAVRMEYEVVQF